MDFQAECGGYPPLNTVIVFSKSDTFATYYKRKLSRHVETVCLLSKKR